MQARTDLAKEQLQALGDQLPEGVKASTETVGAIEIHTVKIQSSKGAAALGKPKGTYITLELIPLSQNSIQEGEELEAAAERIRSLLPEKGPVLVVGLGNEQITPDALGPRTIQQMLVTRHIAGEVAKAAGLEGLRPVAALAPGVLGQTGVETSEIIASVTARIAPAAAVVIDALAAREPSRLGATLQMADSGISPGAGVFNARTELSRQTLGVPVVSLGIPTVVDAVSLAGDLLESQEALEKKRALFSPRGAQMMVTPREIDLIIQRGARFLSLALNRALQPQVAVEDLSYLLS